MFAISPVATASTALSVPASVAATPAADLVSTRTTPVAVIAPLSGSQVTNDSRNATPATSTTAAEQAPQSASTAAAYADTASTGGPSTAFLAQLISQNAGADEDNQIALASSYAGFAPAPSYTTFISYGIVKYRPSNAGLPTAYAPQASAAQSDASATTPASEAYNATQSRNVSNLSTQQPAIAFAS